MGWGFKKPCDFSEKLSRRIIETVTVNWKPGLPTISTIKEDYLAKYCVTMSDMEFGLCWDVMHKAYLIAEKSWRSYFFKNWAEGGHGLMVLQQTSNTTQ